VLKQGTCYISSNEYSLALRLNEKGEACFSLGDTTLQPLNLLFSSAAETFHQKTVGVLLTGVGEDGAEGFARIRQEKGVTIVEDTQCCVYPNLVDNAIQHGVVDEILQEGGLPKAIESIMVQSPDLMSQIPLEDIEEEEKSSIGGDIIT
jgi:two-component system chemotaxis response regulator CheB